MRDLPSGFGYDPNCQAWGGVRAGREVLRQRCWFTRGEPSSSVTVTELKGLISRAEVDAELAVQVSRHRSWQTFEAVEPVVIARHSGWAWYQNTTTKDQITGIGYVAVLPWTDSSYVIEFSGRRAQDVDRELARRVVSSFAVVRKGDLQPGKVLVALVLALAAYLGWRRLRAAQAVAEPPASGPLTLQERQGSTRPPTVPKPPKR